MRLQEISKKMLAKRRRICVDTQTENLSTIRVRDVAITVEEPKVFLKDVSILTDIYEEYHNILPFDKFVPRVKEMSTTTQDLPNSSVIKFKDAANFTEDPNHDDDTLYNLQNDIKNYFPFNNDNTVQTTSSNTDDSIFNKDNHQWTNEQASQFNKNDIKSKEKHVYHDNHDKNDKFRKKD